jgi:ABC-2 type transport system permease protein
VVIGAQYINFSVTTDEVSGSENWLYSAAIRSAALMHWMPPGFAARAVLRDGSSAVVTGNIVLLALWTAAFAAGFAYRLRKQYQGEYLAEGTVTPRAIGKPGPTPPVRDETTHGWGTQSWSLLSPGLEACLRKEWLYLRSSGNQFVAMATPLIFVAIFCRGTLSEHPSYLLQASIGYALLGPLAALYNVFGADGCGVQLYLMAPVRLRDVVLAKNLLSLALLGIQVVLAWALANWLSVRRIPLATQVAAALWVVFVLGINLALGTLRSIQSPRKFAPGQMRQLRGAPASRTSNLLVLAILFGSLLLQAPVVWLCKHYQYPALAVLIFAPLAGAGVGAYALLLRRADRLILEHRDALAHELCGA